MPSVPLKAIKDLCYTRAKVKGNHRKDHRIATNGDKLRVFTYHCNIVCVVNPRTLTYYTDDCGYVYSPSTSWTLRSYDDILSGSGYTKVTKEQAKEEGWCL